MKVPYVGASVLKTSTSSGRLLVVLFRELSIEDKVIVVDAYDLIYETWLKLSLGYWFISIEDAKCSRIGFILIVEYEEKGWPIATTD